jgi:hypothetical protein
MEALDCLLFGDARNMLAYQGLRFVAPKRGGGGEGREDGYNVEELHVFRVMSQYMSVCVLVFVYECLCLMIQYPDVS